MLDANRELRGGEGPWWTRELLSFVFHYGTSHLTERRVRFAGQRGTGPYVIPAEVVAIPDEPLLVVGRRTPIDERLVELDVGRSGGRLVRAQVHDDPTFAERHPDAAEAHAVYQGALRARVFQIVRLELTATRA